MVLHLPVRLGVAVLEADGEVEEEIVVAVIPETEIEIEAGVISEGTDLLCLLIAEMVAKEEEDGVVVMVLVPILLLKTVTLVVKEEDLDMVEEKEAMAIVVMGEEADLPISIEEEESNHQLLPFMAILIVIGLLLNANLVSRHALVVVHLLLPLSKTSAISLRPLELLLLLPLVLLLLVLPLLVPSRHAAQPPPLLPHLLAPLLLEEPRQGAKQPQRNNNLHL